MELLPLVCLCLLSWSGTTSADHHERVVVKEDDDAVLNCSFNGVNIETGVFDWKRDEDQKNVFLYAAGYHYNNGRLGQAEQFKGRVFHFQDELKHGNASIKINRTTMADSGNYTCDFPNNYPSPTFHIELVVGAAPRPYVKILHETKTSALLQCKAHGVPDLEVHWQDSDGNKLPAEKTQVSESGGHLYITLNTTVTKTDRFYCVATQKNLGHTISAEVYVNLPVVVEEGSDVILPCSFDVDIRGELLEWKKGQKEVFVYDSGIHHNNGRTGQDEQFKGRVSHFQDELKRGNASIKIRNAKMADSGDYTCDVPHNTASKMVHVELFVGGELKERPGENIRGAAPKPYITILHQTDDWAQLQCEANGVPDLEVKWQDSDGNILAEERQVSGSDRKYITLLTTVTKTDNFSCVATQENLSYRISSQIYVHINKPVLKDRPDENIPGAAPKPFITILHQTDDWARLQCEAHGVPDLDVKWQDSDGNILAEERQASGSDRKYITLLTTVTKTDNFYCVATQKNLSHRISAHIYVRLPEPVLKDRPDENIPGAAPKPYITILHQTDDWARLQCKAHGVPDLDVKWQDSDGNILAEERQVSGSDRKFITLLTTVTKTGNFSCVATQENLSYRISSQIYVHINKDKPQIPLSAVLGLVVAAVFITLLVVAVVVGVLLYKGYIKVNRNKGKKQPEEEPMTQPNPEKQADPEAVALKSV